MSKLKGGLRLLGKVVLGIVLALAVADLVLTLVLGRMVRSEIARLKADGYPTTIDEIAPKKIPDSENAAVIYAKAFKAMGPRLRYEDSEDFSVLFSPEKRLEDPVSWGKGMQILARRRPVIALIEQACSRPKCVFPVKWEKGMDAEFPHNSELMSLASLLSADATVNAIDGRADQAVDRLVLRVKLSESLADEPAWISQLVRYHMIRKQAGRLGIVARNVHINALQARRLYDAFSCVNIYRGYARVEQGELAVGIWSFDHLRRNPRLIEEYLMALPAVIDFAHPNKDAWRSGIAPLHSRTPISYIDELIYLRGIADRARYTSQPYRVVKVRRPDLVRDRYFPPYAILSEVMLPGSKLMVGRDDAVAAINGSQVLCALLAYRDRFGGYPQSLGELRSKLGWKLPVDPYSGKDFIYRRQGKGFILYSIGMNLKDDGGRSYDYPPQDVERPDPVETPPPGYEATAKPAPSGGVQSTPGATGAVPVETPPPGWTGGPAGLPNMAPPPPPKPARKPKPPYSTREMRYTTVDGRHSEDIIWELDR